MRAAIRYQAEGVRLVEGMTREEACRKYHRKVLLLARRVHEQLSADATVDLDDLVSNGSIGLLDAFDRFEAARGIQFSTFAEYRIRGQMYDALRSNDTFTRRRRQEQKRMHEAHETVRRLTGRDPEPREVAEYLGIGLDDYWRRIDKVKPVSLMSLDATGTGDDEEGRPLLEKIADRSEPEAEKRMLMAEVRAQLKVAISELREKERHCVLMYYGKEMSLAEIAEVYGVTVSRISQILKDARAKLRVALEPLVEGTDLVVGTGA